MRAPVLTFTLLTATHAYSADNVGVEAGAPSSRYNESYRCIADTVGGYSHKKRSHRLTEFSGEELFFLTHVSDVPEEAIRERLAQNFEDPSVLQGIDRSELMRLWNWNILATHKGGIFVPYREQGSYFLRTPDENPREATWLSANGCTAMVEFETTLIKCDAAGGINWANHTEKLFILNADNSRFSYAYLGSWHKPHDGNKGDSSVFAFGQCKPYYP